MLIISVLGLYLVWTMTMSIKNCYALCHLIYICGCKGKVQWTRMFVLTCLCLYTGKTFHDANEVKLATSEGSFIVFTKIDIMRAFYFNVG